MATNNITADRLYHMVALDEPQNKDSKHVSYIPEATNYENNSDLRSWKVAQTVN